MLRIRQLLAAIFICSTLAITCAFAQSSLTQIRDTITNSDGTPFNGMVVITWNGFSVPSGAPVSQLSASASIYNGALSVLLVPTTTASAGTYYQVVYNSSDGTVTWTETWQVPPSTTALTISQVRQSTTQGSGGTTTAPTNGQYATLPISIVQVTALSSDLANINSAISTLNTEIANIPTNSTLTTLQSTVAALGTTVSGLSTTVNGLSTTVPGISATVGTLNTTVSGLSTTVTSLGSATAGLTGTVNGLTTTVSGLSTSVTSNNTSIASLTSGLSTTNTTVSGLSTSLTNLTNIVNGLVTTVNTLTSNGSSAVFVDAEVPGGTANGANTQFTLANAPSPATSFALYRNGLVQSPSVDYTLAGSVLTFLSVSVPQPTDLLRAFYRMPGTASSAHNFMDPAAPTGIINGTNLVFTLANAPSPAASLKLYKNGLLLSQTSDYTISAKTITFTSKTTTAQTGDSLIATYRY